MSFGKFLKILLFGSFLWAAPGFAQLGEVDDIFPDFTLLDIEDQPHTLSDHAGKAILLFLLTPS